MGLLWTLLSFVPIWLLGVGRGGGTPIPFIVGCGSSIIYNLRPKTVYADGRKINRLCLMGGLSIVYPIHHMLSADY